MKTPQAAGRPPEVARPIESTSCSARAAQPSNAAAAAKRRRAMDGRVSMITSMASLDGRWSEALVRQQVAPLPCQQPRHRHPADAQAPYAQQLQADGMALVRDLARLE